MGIIRQKRDALGSILVEKRWKRAAAGMVTRAQADGMK
jgi:hypothetical protein